LLVDFAFEVVRYPARKFDIFESPSDFAGRV